MKRSIIHDLPNHHHLDYHVVSTLTMSTTALLNSVPTEVNDSNVAEILRQIRSTSYVAEVLSGEEDPEESDLLDVVLPISTPGPRDVQVGSDLSETVKVLRTAPSPSVQARSQVQWGTSAIVVIDSTTTKDDTLLVIQLDSDARVQDTLRVVPRSVMEIVRPSDWRIVQRVCTDL